MQNDMRNRLVELIKQGANGHTLMPTDSIADHLIANGVIVPPCKVGQTVWFIQDKTVYEGKVIRIRPFIHKDHTNFHGNIEYEFEDPFYHDGRKVRHEISCVFEEFGSNLLVYFSKEQAEQKLKELRVDNG